MKRFNISVEESAIKAMVGEVVFNWVLMPMNYDANMQGPKCDGRQGYSELVQRMNLQM